MRIGIIGAGRLGTGLGKRLAAAGHEVVVSFAKSEEELAAAAAAIGHGAHGASVEEAACHGEVVILATPWDLTLEVVRSLAPLLADKIVWDSTNPLKSDMSGLAVGTDTSAGEEVARAAPGARVVKAVAPFAEVLHSESTVIGGQLPGVFVNGDDPVARRVVLALVADLPAQAVEAGPLTNARYTEPLGMLLVQLAYVEGLGARIGAALVRE